MLHGVVVTTKGLASVKLAGSLRDLWAACRWKVETRFEEQGWKVEGADNGSCKSRSWA